MRLDASRASDGRDSWKVTAVQTLDLCLVGDLGLSCCHSGKECCGECEARHDCATTAVCRRACLKKSWRGRKL